MSDRTDAGASGQGSTSGDQGSNGQNQNANANTGSTGQGSQNASNNGSNGQGSTDTDITKHPAFVALSQKLDGAISDNARYRDRLRRLAADDGDNQGSTNGNGSGTDNGEAKTLLQELRKERALNRLSASASRKGFRTPDLILNFVNLSEVADEMGNVANPDTVLDDLKSKYPDLFKTVQDGNGDGNAGSRGRQGNDSGDMNAMIRRRTRETRLA